MLSRLRRSTAAAWIALWVVFGFSSRSLRAEEPRPPVEREVQIAGDEQPPLEQRVEVPSPAAIDERPAKLVEDRESSRIRTEHIWSEDLAEGIEPPTLQLLSEPVAGAVDHSAVTAQALSLPQGAGKVQGLGESFTAQVSTGIGTARIPLSLPTARGDADPSIALSYSSATGRGAAGLGWTLELPSVSRQTDRGTPRYLDPPAGTAWQPTQDRFLYGGSEIVPICLVGTAGQCAGAQSGEVMPSWAGGWSYFRARMEGSYVRLFWSPDRRTWRVQDKSGTTLELGVPLDGSNASDALEIDPARPSHIFRWNLSRQLDAVGGMSAPANPVVYRWSNVDGTGYLSDIFDTPPRGGGAVATWAHHVHLAWETRPDAVWSYRSGYPRRDSWRLSRIDVTSAPFLGGGSRGLVRRYHLSYEPGLHVSLLASVQLEGRCESVNPTEGTDQLLPTTTGCPTLEPTTLGYTHVQGFTAAGKAATADLAGFEPFDDRVHALDGSPSVSLDGKNGDLIDLNADGLPDVLAFGATFGAADGGFLLGVGGTADRYTASKVTVNGVGGDNFQTIKFDNLNVTVQDLDGDGVVDFVHMPIAQKYMVYTPRPTGDGNFVLDGRLVPTASQQNLRIDFTHYNKDIQPMDVNGDGLVDLVFSSGSEYQTFFSLARYPGGVDQYGYADFTSAETAAISNDPVRTCVPNGNGIVRLSDSDVRVADMNGDGLPDLVRLRSGSAIYWPGRGNGFFGTGNLDDCPAGTTGLNRFVTMTTAPSFPQGATLRTADVNGDGLDDVVQIAGSAINVWLNVDGASFSKVHGITSYLGRSGNAYVRIADINGSGTRDIVWGDGYGYKYVDPAGGQRPWLLSRIGNGLGKTTDIQYRTSTELMLEAARAGAPWESTTPMPLHVVSRVVTSDNLPVAGRPASSYAVEYAYRDPVYDGRQREFRGFRTVRVITRGDQNSPTSSFETRYLLGECEEEVAGTTSCTPDARWRDNPREALKGLPLATTNFDEKGVHQTSVHYTYRLRRLYTGLDGREVRDVFESATDTWRYDTGAFVTGVTPMPMTSVELELEPGVVTASRTDDFAVESASGAAHLRTRRVLDVFGNTTESIDEGCLQGDGACPAADEAIVQHAVPGRPVGDDSGWRWRLIEQWNTGAGPRKWHHAFLSYDAAGHLTETRAELVGTLPLDRFHADATKALAPPPAEASHDGLVLLGTTHYDAYGNADGTTGAHGRCRSRTYDDAYAELVTVESIFVGDATGVEGCGGRALNAVAGWDRGLLAPTFLVDAHGELTTMAYDGFGRPVQVHKPHPTIPGTVTALPSTRFQYFLPSDPATTPFTVIHTQLQAGPDVDSAEYSDGWSYVDGMSRAVVALQEADPGAGDGGSFAVSGLTAYDAKGAAERVYDPWFWSGDPKAFPLTAAPTTPYKATRYDAFGRVFEQRGLDGALTLRNVYHALETEHWDAADVEPGPHEGTPASDRVDGHGRTVAMVERLHVGGAIEAHETRSSYLPGGELASQTRVRVGAADAPVVRWARYDSLGRMVLNVQPDTSRNFTADTTAEPATLKAWRYAWNDDGDLVGTSDARGCGENLFYDAAGRPLGEDYSPCLATQADYSPPDLASGAGLEVRNVFDVVPDDAAAIPGFAIDGSLLLGQLVARYDLGCEAVTRFDGRARATGFARRLARPGVGSTAFAARYTSHWFTRATSFDGADRPVTDSTGADVPELLGADGSSTVTSDYSARGLVSHVGSSYGALVASVHHDADGIDTQIVYGDAASTTTDLGYDARHRLGTLKTWRVPPGIWSEAPPTYTPGPGAAPTLQAVLQDLRFTYDSVNNPTLIEDRRDPTEWPAGAKPVTRAVQYDDLYRVTRVDYRYTSGDDAWVSPFAAELAGATDRRRAQPSPHVRFDHRVGAQTFDWDWLGNLVHGDDDAQGFYDRSLGTQSHGTAADGPYQLRGATNEGGDPARAGHLATQFDAAGNLTDLIVVRSGPCLPATASCSQRFHYDWDELNRLERARRWDGGTLGMASGPLPAFAPAVDLGYVYGADDQRVLKSATDGGGVVFYTAYVFGSLELRRALYDGAHNDYERSAITEVAYLEAKGQRVARLHYGPAGLPSLSAGRLHVLFELPDQLGSSTTVIDRETGELVERSTYQLFGAADSDYRSERWGSFREDHRFTGKEEDVEVGLDYFGKRYYAPLLGRFISADPLAVHQFGADPNLYAYVHGQVLIAIDVTGLAPEWLHTALDVVSFVPGVGSIADLGHAVVYATEGRWASAAVSVAVAVPFVHEVGEVAKIGKAVVKGGEKLSVAIGVHYAEKRATEWAASAAAHKVVNDEKAALHQAANAEKQVVQGEAHAAANEARSEAHAGALPGSGGCFVPGTLVETAAGRRPIESLRVGERVLTVGTIDDLEDATDVDFATWRLVTLRLINPDGSGDAFDLVLLRPLAWLDEQGASEGRTIDLVLSELGVEGPAEVVSIGEAPQISNGPGRVVLGTITHVSNEVLSLRFADGSLLQPTAVHRLYSLDRARWVAAADLAIGEDLATARGVAEVLTAHRVDGSSRVYNLEIESEHSYLVGDDDVLSHNTCSEKSGPALPESYWRERKAPTQVEPGTRKVTEQKPSSRGNGATYERTTHYDEYGRSVGQTHRTDHGEPAVHPNPHHHTRNPATGQESKALPGTHPAEGQNSANGSDSVKGADSSKGE